MHLRINENRPIPNRLRLNSLSVGFKVVYSSAVETEIRDTYKNKLYDELKVIIKDRYKVSDKPSEYTISDNYIIGRRHRDLRVTITDTFKFGSGSLLRVTMSDRYKNSTFYNRQITHKVASMYRIKHGFVKKSHKIKDSFKTQMFPGQVRRVLIHDRYQHLRTRERAHTWVDLFKNKFVSGNIAIVKDIYSNSMSRYLFNPGDENIAISVSKGYGVLSYKINKAKLGIDINQNIRVFVNIPPLYINYCATLKSDKSLAHLTEDAENFYLNIPNIASASTDEEARENISKLSHLTLSIYKYNTEDIDTRKMVNGEMMVGKNVYDPELLSNLNYKLIDIRDESISINEDQKNRNSDSKKFEIRFSTSKICCFDREIVINGYTSSICNIPSVIIQYDIITKEQDGEFLFNNRLNGFQRYISKIEQDSASKPRP